MLEFAMYWNNSVLYAHCSETVIHRWLLATIYFNIASMETKQTRNVVDVECVTDGKLEIISSDFFINKMKYIDNWIII